MAIDALDAGQLEAATYGGMINEDVMQKIWDISRIPLPLSDMLGTETAKNPYKEWPVDKLSAVSTSNAVVDGALFSSITNAATTGNRVGNHCQISAKKVDLSTRAQDVDSVAGVGSLSYQVMQRQRELRRDIEAISLMNQASVKSNPDADTAGKCGGLDAWLTTNVSNGAGGSNGGFNTSTGIVGVATVGTKRALSEKMVRDVIQSVYTQGGDPTVLMSIPAIIRGFSEYLFTASARIGTITTDTSGETKATAIGAVNVFVSDFGTLELVDNRLQPTYTSTGGAAGDAASLFVISPDMLARIWLRKPTTETAAKVALADARVMHADWSLMVKNEAAHGVIRSIDHTAAVVSG